MDIYGGSDCVVRLTKRPPAQRKAYAEGFLYAIRCLGEDRFDGNMDDMRLAGKMMVTLAEQDLEKEKQDGQGAD